jgi:hypothetical protein
VPKSSGREELSVLIGLGVLTLGIAFDIRDLRKLPFRPAFVTKVLKSLRQAGVIERVSSGKYLFTQGFMNAIKGEILSKTPRSDLMQFPTMTIFDVCGVESWNQRDVESFMRRLREHWTKVAQSSTVSAPVPPIEPTSRLQV